MRVLSLSFLSALLLSGAASASTPPTADQMDNLVGAYRLSDGQTLRVEAAGNVLLGGITPRLPGKLETPRMQRLVPAGEHKLATEDGKFVLTYTPGQPVEVVALSYEKAKRAQ